MDMHITGKGVELLPDARSYVIKKLDKINRHLPNILSFDVVLAEESTRDPSQRFIAQVTIDSNGTLLRGEERSQDMFSAVDKLAEVMERQIEHYRGKRNNKGRGYSAIRGNTSEPTDLGNTAEPEMPPKVVKTKQFNIKPMSLDEAVDQMELLGHDFFLFLNESERVNLLYRRKDGNYGLIEPSAK